MRCGDVTTASVCSAPEAGLFWNFFGPGEREDALRVCARLEGTGLRVDLVMAAQELSRHGLGGV
jgi:hypothetical protein